MGLIKDIKDIEQLSLKEQLQSYDIVVLRNDQYYPQIFIKNKGEFFTNSGPIHVVTQIDEYNDNLEHEADHNKDVIEIYRLKYQNPGPKIYQIKNMLKNYTDMSKLHLQGDYELIWERTK